MLRFGLAPLGMINVLTLKIGKMVLQNSIMPKKQKEGSS